MKKAIVILMVAIAFTFLFKGYAIAKQFPIVIIGGAGSTYEQLEPLHLALPGSKVIIPEKYYPLSSAAAVVLEQIREQGIEGPFIVVGWSWGAILAHQINGLYEGTVVAIIGIASPLDIAFVPSFLGAPFNPDDRNSRTPFCAIAGVKPGIEKKWYMTSNESDGTVDVDAAFKVGNRNMIASAKIVDKDADHWNVVRHPRTIEKVVEWVALFAVSDNQQILLVKNEQNLP